jgi:hypothetical protein
MSTRNYQAGDSYGIGFTVKGATGALAAADSTPVGALYHNGTADGTVTVTVTSSATGVYSATCTIPGGYSVGDRVSLLITATVGGVATGEFVDNVRLVGYPNNALPNAAASAAGGVLTVGSGSGQLAPSGGKVAATVAHSDGTDSAAALAALDALLDSGDPTRLSTHALSAAPDPIATTLPGSYGVNTLGGMVYNAWQFVSANWYYATGAITGGGASTVTFESANAPALDVSGNASITVWKTLGGQYVQSARVAAYDPTSRVATIDGSWLNIPDPTGWQYVLGWTAGEWRGILAPNALDQINTTPAAGVASNFREQLIDVWRWFYKPKAKTASGPTAGTITTLRDNSTTKTTSAYTDDGAGNETQGAAT